MNVEGVPDSVPWAKVSDFLESLGLDLANMPARQGGVVIGDKDISCTVYARNTDGDKYVDRATGQLAKHQIHIPFTDAPWHTRVRQAEADQTCGPVHVWRDGAQACDCELNRDTA